MFMLLLMKHLLPYCYYPGLYYTNYALHNYLCTGVREAFGELVPNLGLKSVAAYWFGLP